MAIRRRSIPFAESAARQRNRSGLELALRPDHHRLLIAARPQRDIGGKAGSVCNDLNHARARAPFDAALDVPAAFGPGSRDCRTLRHDIAGQVESVAVACAGQRLLQAAAAGADRVGGAATNALGRAIVERHGATAAPHSRHARKGPAGLRVAVAAPARCSDQGCDREDHAPRHRDAERFLLTVATLHFTSPIRLRWPLAYAY